MEYVRFGSTGMKVSRLCLGCMTYGSKAWREWVLNEDDAKPFFKAAFEAGINFYDTADVYSLGASEEVLGRAVKEYAARREEVVVATKVFNPMGKAPNLKGLSRKHIMEGIDASLKRLKMDYVDLYIIHRFDYETEIEETLEALSDVVKAGKALYLGASSMWSWQFAKMLTLQKERGLARFVSMQNYYNLIYREEEREMLPLCKEEKIAVTPWSPIARGFLAGSMPSQGEKTVRGNTDDFAKTLGIGATDTDHEIAERVRVTAEKLGVSRAAVAIAWTLANPVVTSSIVGASKPHHLADALKALEIKFDAETRKYLEEPYRTRKPTGHA
ncbi:MAG: aldo/keto reductase [Xanthobacteraceae bacterium]|nr:aldo/keto reductase [Xanthobacteraceae bacterium]MBX3548667.1 aldo/keto reductase [Xanthobacteraceae bacterium]MCW5678583.1 aldo/keto reductase [Xanthobacteraceae bacterium]